MAAAGRLILNSLRFVSGRAMVVNNAEFHGGIVLY
jgi:hypothetical protein